MCVSVCDKSNTNILPPQRRLIIKVSLLICDFDSHWVVYDVQNQTQLND